MPSQPPWHVHALKSGAECFSLWWYDAVSVGNVLEMTDQKCIAITSLEIAAGNLGHLKPVPSSAIAMVGRGDLLYIRGLPYISPPPHHRSPLHHQDPVPVSEQGSPPHPLYFIPNCLPTGSPPEVKAHPCWYVGNITILVKSMFYLFFFTKFTHTSPLSNFILSGPSPHLFLIWRVKLSGGQVVKINIALKANVYKKFLQALDKSNRWANNANVLVVCGRNQGACKIYVAESEVGSRYLATVYHRSEYTPQIFVIFLLYLFNDNTEEVRLLQWKVVSLQLLLQFTFAVPSK